MPEPNLFRRLKARGKLSLLRRWSSPGPLEKTGSGADPANVNIASDHLPPQQQIEIEIDPHPHPHPHLHLHLHESCRFSTTSSLPADHLSSEEDIVGRAAALTPGAAAPEEIAATQCSAPTAHETDDDPDEEGPVLHPEPEREPELEQEQVPDRSTSKNCQGECRHKTSPGGPLGHFTFPPSTAAAAATTSASPPDSGSRQHSVSQEAGGRVVSPTVNTPLPPPLLETVRKGASDGRSHTAISKKNNSDDSHHTAIVSRRPSVVTRKQSLLPSWQQHLVDGLLDSEIPYLEMGQRKVWVKRPGASATLIAIAEDSVVDELRDHVLRKYSNSLGKVFDSPDLLVRISPRGSPNRQIVPERILSPEEPITPIIDTYYPGGQTVEEALIIDAPRRTPKPSPRQPYYYHAEPGDHGEYFPLMPVPINVGTPPAHPVSAMSSNSGVSTHPHQTSSISVLTTGKVPLLPSPGNRSSRHPPRRPPYARHATNSPTLVASVSKDPNIAINGQAGTTAPSLPTPPAPAAPPDSPTSAPIVRTASPRPGRKIKKAISPSGGAFGGLIEGTVPPINVLIVEDNVINQKLLEAFMKRLSVRWQCAPNGEVAVKKWRQGGFHLVLMDIQLPVMNGLEATKEIRRLERLNGIGVFSKTASGRSSAASTTTEGRDNVYIPPKEDILENLSLFKSPVIIVALTASSLQSDRHEALAAGCNDFLTKPVGFPWLEQKVTEWGCMQALIDFEGWRKWRGYEDHPRMMRTATVPAPRKLSSGKDGSKVTVVASPGSSGSGSSRSEDTEVFPPFVQEAATGA